MARFVQRMTSTSHGLLGGFRSIVCKTCVGEIDSTCFLRKSGCPTWIRTMTKASKGPCATITPSDKPLWNLSTAPAACKGKCDFGTRFGNRLLGPASYHYRIVIRVAVCVVSGNGVIVVNITNPGRCSALITAGAAMSESGPRHCQRGQFMAGLRRRHWRQTSLSSRRHTPAFEPSQAPREPHDPGRRHV